MYYFFTRDIQLFLISAWEELSVCLQSGLWDLGGLVGPDPVLFGIFPRHFTSSTVLIEIASTGRSFPQNDLACAGYPHGKDGWQTSRHGNGNGVASTEQP